MGLSLTKKAKCDDHLGSQALPSIWLASDWSGAQALKLKWIKMAINCDQRLQIRKYYNFL